MFVKQSAILVLAVASALSLAMLTASTPASAASDLLPDLRMGQLGDLEIETTSSGQRLLRFSANIVNVGEGPFEVHGQRSGDSDSMDKVTQRIYNDANGFRNRATGATMYFGGDGHDHWHVKNLMRFELKRPGKRALVGTGVKRGFCFYDNYRFATDQDPYYLDGVCGVREDTEVSMGLSVGWGDWYDYTLPDQHINITGLQDGRYRLKAAADKAGQFIERNERNNHTYVDIEIEGNNTPTVLAYGPSA